MDIVCAGMYRSCSTWQYTVIAHLLEAHQGAERLGYLTGDDYAALPPSASWRVLKSHEGHRSFTRAIASRQASAVYAYRDVRDVVYSLAHKRSVSVATLLSTGMLHQILANDHYWTTRPGVLVQRYEEIMARPVESVEELARHMGLRIDREHAAAIAATYSLSENRKRAEALRQRLATEGRDLDSRDNAQCYDPHTLLHWNHMRDGRVGSWREVATPGELRVLGALLAPWLFDKGYESSREWANQSHPALADSLRWTSRRLRGSLVCGSRRLSARFPRLAGAARQVLGIHPTAQAVAVGNAVPASHLPLGQEQRPQRV